MGQVTKIEWCDHTFNPWRGCAKVSAGCKNCYAETSPPARVARAKGIETWGPENERVHASDAMWLEPEKWNRAAESDGVRRRVFCASLADVFEDRRDLDGLRVRLFDLIRRTPSLDWLLLTKRPQNIDPLLRLARDRAFYLAERCVPGTREVGLMLDQWTRAADPPKNVWLGVSAENQETADTRIPILLARPAAVRFVSAEPLLGSLDLSSFLGSPIYGYSELIYDGIDWVIVGGESGPEARPCRIDWITSIVEQCRRAKVAVFVKQLGGSVIDRNDRGFLPDSVNTWPEDTEFGESLEGMNYQGAPCAVLLRHPKGGDIDEWTPTVKVREFPPPPQREPAADK
jgi:protein gp37